MDDEEFAAFVAGRGSALLRTACYLTGSRADGEYLLLHSLTDAYASFRRIRAPQALEAHVRTTMARAVVSDRPRAWRRSDAPLGLLREASSPRRGYVMTDEIETRATEHFGRSESTTMTIPADFAETVIRAGQERRARRRAVTGVGVGLVAALVATLALNAPSIVDRYAGPIDPGPGPPTSVRAWLKSLDPVNDEHVAYVSQQTLHIGPRTIDLTGPEVDDGTDIELRAAVTDGWIADVSGASYTLAVVHPDGTVEPLGPFPHNTDGVEVSPDGSEAIIGYPAFAVIDVVSGAVVATPPRQATTVTWTADGIYLIREPRGVVQLWSPPEPAAPAPFARGLACNGEASLAASIIANTRRCVAFLSLSPSGHFGLTSTGIQAVESLHAVGSGHSAPLQGYPGGGYSDYPTPYDWRFAKWEDDTHVVISMFFRTARSFAPVTVLVRCEAILGECVRVSPRLTPDDPEQTPGFVLVP